MAPRPFWMGYLKLSLVACPVAMSPAHTQSEKIRFHMLNRKTGDRVESRYLDAETNEVVVDDDDLVKGYERGRGRLRPARRRGARRRRAGDDADDRHRMFRAAGLDRIYLVRSTALSHPNGEIGVEAYSVIREAIAATTTAGLSRLVLAAAANSSDARIEPSEP
jgi:DNA end-binding protein Ku